MEPDRSISSRSRICYACSRSKVLCTSPWRERLAPPPSSSRAAVVKFQDDAEDSQNGSEASDATTPPESRPPTPTPDEHFLSLRTRWLSALDINEIVGTGSPELDTMLTNIILRIAVIDEIILGLLHKAEFPSTPGTRDEVALLVRESRIIAAFMTDTLLFHIAHGPALSFDNSDEEDESDSGEEDDRMEDDAGKSMEEMDVDDTENKDEDKDEEDDEEENEGEEMSQEGSESEEDEPTGDEEQSDDGEDDVHEPVAGSSNLSLEV